MHYSIADTYKAIEIPGQLHFSCKCGRQMVPVSIKEIVALTHF